MLYLAWSDLVKVALPGAELSQIVSRQLRKENVTGLTAIHHPLCNVNAGAGDIDLVVDIHHPADGPTMNSHANGEPGMLLECARDCQGALHRRLHAGGKDEGHSVPGRQPGQLAAGFGGKKLSGVANETILFIKEFALIIDATFNVFIRVVIGYL